MILLCMTLLLAPVCSIMASQESLNSDLEDVPVDDAGGAGGLFGERLLRGGTSIEKHRVGRRLQSGVCCQRTNSSVAGNKARIELQSSGKTNHLSWATRLHRRTHLSDLQHTSNFSAYAKYDTHGRMHAKYLYAYAKHDKWGRQHTRNVSTFVKHYTHDLQHTRNLSVYAKHRLKQLTPDNTLYTNTTSLRPRVRKSRNVSPGRVLTSLADGYSRSVSSLSSSSSSSEKSGRDKPVVWVAGLFPLSDSLPAGAVGRGVLPAVHIALDDINNDRRTDRKYTLQIAENDTQVSGDGRWYQRYLRYFVYVVL